MSKDLEEVRRDILRMYERIQNQNYYEVLGVDQEADPAMINSQYRALTREWHIDRFSSLDLGDDKAKVQEIFAFVNNAHRTLSNADDRSAYDMEIDDGPDLVEILNAESAFRTGKNFLQRGSYKGAHENFKSAFEAHPDEPEYEAYYLYTAYLLEPKDETGRVPSKARSAEIFARLDEIHQSTTSKKKDWILTFMGSVALGLGKDREAVGLFREALYANKNNTEARRQLRLVEIRQRKKKKSFFGGLLDKLKG